MKSIAGRLRRPSSINSTSHIKFSRSSGKSAPDLYKGRALLAILFALSCILSAQSSLAENLKKVVFIRYNIKPFSISAVTNKFKATMAERGYSEGVNIEYVDILTQGPSRESILEIFEATDKHRDSADLFDGKNTIEKTLPRPARQFAFVNMESADRLQIPIPFAALEAVDLVIK